MIPVSSFVLRGVVLALAAATATSGCDSHTCLASESPAGLLLRFEGPGQTAPPPATYEIVLEVDGDTYSMACGVPDGATAFSCEAAEGTGDHRIEHDLDSDAPGPLSIRITHADGADRFGPEEVRVQVVSGDAPLVDATFEPSYERDEPNGEGCGLVDHEVEQVVVIDGSA